MVEETVSAGDHKREEMFAKICFLVVIAAVAADIKYSVGKKDIDRCVSVLQSILRKQTRMTGARSVGTRVSDSFCDGKTDGNYADPERCDGFISCSNEIPYRMACQSNLYYNIEKDQCDYPENVDCEGRYPLVHQGETCYDARDRRPGTFAATSSGAIVELKLVHKSGYLNCYKYDDLSRSIWGCNNRDVSAEKPFGTVITTAESDKVVLPLDTVSHTPGWFYGLDGFDKDSPILVLTDYSKSVKVSKGQTMRVWYGEDLTGVAVADNEGTHCVDVYAKIVPDM